MLDLIQTASRRALLGVSGKALSAAGLAVLLGASVSGCAKSEPSAQQDAAPSGQDTELLNAAIALEHEGIAAYTIAAASGLLQPAVAQLGVTFRGHHERHRDELIRAVTTLGGAPVEARSESDYATQLNVASLRDQAGVLRLALGLERGAANAYLGLIPSLGADFHQIAARMAGDETFHAAILGNALGEPIPAEGLMFGA